MILTLTPNPSLDRTVSLPGPLQRGAVQRLTGVVMEPGGKGVNVARVLSNSGRAATAVLPAAEHDPILAALGVRADVEQPVRADVDIPLNVLSPTVRQRAGLRIPTKGGNAVPITISGRIDRLEHLGGLSSPLQRGGEDRRRIQGHKIRSRRSGLITSNVIERDVDPPLNPALKVVVGLAVPP